MTVNSRNSSTYSPSAVASMKSAKPARTNIASSPGVIKPGREAYIKRKIKTVEYNRVKKLASLFLVSFHAVVVFLSSFIASLKSGFTLMAKSLADGVRQYRGNGTTKDIKEEEAKIEMSKSGRAAAKPAQEDNKPLSKAEAELVEVAKHQNREKKKRKRTPKTARGGDKAEQEQESGGFETTCSVHDPQIDIEATGLIQMGSNTGIDDPGNNEGWTVAESKAKKRAGKKQAVIILQAQAPTQELQVDKGVREYDANGSIQLSGTGHSDIMSDNDQCKSEHSSICSDPSRPDILSDLNCIAEDTSSAEPNAPNSSEDVKDSEIVEDTLSEEAEDNHIMEDHIIEASNHSQGLYNSDIIEEHQVQSAPEEVWTEVTSKKKHQKSVSALSVLQPTAEMPRLNDVGRFAALADGFSDNFLDYMSDADSHQVTPLTCSGSLSNPDATTAEPAQTACETIEWDVTGTETDEEVFVGDVEDDEMSSLVTEVSSFPPTPADRITPPPSIDAGDSEETSQQMTPKAAKKEEPWKPKNGDYWADMEDDL